MNLTTATPAQIDTELSALYQAEFALEAAERSAMAAIHRGLGEKLDTTGRGAYRVEKWPTADADALAVMRSKGEELIGMMRPASAIVTKYAAAADALAANRAAQEPLHGEYNRRGGWTRFYAVPGGHVHRTMRCSTCNNGRERTRFDWLLDWSGRDQAEAIAELAAAAHTLCSQSCCFPGAPVAATPAPRKTAAEKAADKATAERTARTEDPKLIADTDGEPLRVDGAVLRTVRSAEIKAADALWWAGYSRNNTNDDASARKYEAQAHKITAALAHKRGTAPAAELAALVVKVTKKLKKDLGAEVADAAAAEWTRQADHAETIAAEPVASFHDLTTPAPLTRQPEPQHTGRDDQGDAEVARESDNTWTPGDFGPEIHDTRPLVLRMELAAVGQVTRELSDDQVAELGRRITSARPHRAAGPLDPFLAARLAQAEDGTGVRKCCTVDATDADCEAVHPGFTTPTAAYAALAAELAEAAETAGDSRVLLAGALDNAAAAGATWATWDGHGRPAAAMLHGTAGLTVRPAGRGEPATFATDEAGRIVARSVGGRYITTAVASAEWLLTVPPPAGDEAACRFCGCTENAACPGGCAWAGDDMIRAAGLEPMDGDVCTACLPDDDGQQAGPDELGPTGALRVGPLTRQQAYLERDQDQDDEGDEARDCVRVTTHTDAAGQRFQWCATHRTNEPIGPDDDEALDDAAEFDAGVAEVLAIAGAAPTVTITDPAGLLALIEQYGLEMIRAGLRRRGHEAETVWCEAHDGAHFEAPDCRYPHLTDTRTRATMNEADGIAAAGTLAQIAAVLGVQADTAAGVPAPRDGEQPPAR